MEMSPECTEIITEICCYYYLISLHLTFSLYICALAALLKMKCAVVLVTHPVLIPGAWPVIYTDSSVIK